MDRREFTRFPVTDHEIIFYVDGNEYIGNIIDVCEKGFKVKVKSKFDAENTKFSYQFYYTSSHNNDKNNLFIVNGDGYVVRSESEDVLGCKVQTNEELNKFVREIIVGLYKTNNE